MTPKRMAQLRSGSMIVSITNMLHAIVSEHIVAAFECISRLRARCSRIVGAPNADEVRNLPLA
jgi:hypothetical protein